MTVNNTTTPTFFGSEQQFLVTLSILSAPSGTTLAAPLNTAYVFDKFAGGDVQASISKHRPGGMGPEISYLALPSYSDVTISKAWNTAVDNGVWAQLNNLIGNTIAQVTVQPLDDGGNAWGQGTVYTGRLAKVTPGGTDANSNAVRMLEVDLSVETVGLTGQAVPNTPATAPNTSLNSATWATTQIV